MPHSAVPLRSPRPQAAVKIAQSSKFVNARYSPRSRPRPRRKTAGTGRRRGGHSSIGSGLAGCPQYFLAEILLHFAACEWTPENLCRTVKLSCASRLGRPSGQALELPLIPVYCDFRWRGVAEIPAADGRQLTTAWKAVGRPSRATVWLSAMKIHYMRMHVRAVVSTRESQRGETRG